MFKFIIFFKVIEEIVCKNVLVVDDLVDQGETMKTVRHHLDEQKPKLLEAAVLFKKPWSKVEPEYYLEVVDRWCVFPFELFEVTRLSVANGETPEAQS